MKSRVNEIAENFLADLGLEAEEEGEDTVDYLPVRADGGSPAKRQDSRLSDLSPTDGGRRPTPQQRQIIELIREGVLIQEGIDSLITQAKARSGRQRLETVMRLESEFHQMLLIRRVTEAQDEELGQLLGPAINREIHARANGITALDDIAEELYLKDIERTYTQITHTPRKRQSFWDNVLGS